MVLNERILSDYPIIPTKDDHCCHNSRGYSSNIVMRTDLNLLVKEAQSGDKKSLEQVLSEVKDMVYNLSMKMMFFHEDAEDATQEILIKVITKLSTFRGQSKFTTWVYRVATNHLLDMKGKESGNFKMSLSEYAAFIDKGQSDIVSTSSNEGEASLMEEEVKVSCTQALLICLDTKHRMAYILGDILDFNSSEGAKIMSLSSDTYRQQLSRARKKIRNFLQAKCGLVNESNSCRCVKKVDFLVNQELISKDSLRFARFEERSIDLMKKIDDLDKETAIYRSNPDFSAPERISKIINKILDSV